MRITWDQVNAKFDEFLGSEIEAGKLELKSLPLRIEAWNWAQDIFCAHTPLQKQMTLELEADGRTAILPSDVYAVDRIYDSEEERFWWPVHFEPGQIRRTGAEDLQFWKWEGQLYLEKNVSTSSTALTLYYWGYYPAIEYEEDSAGVVTVHDGLVSTPRWAQMALMHLATAHIMQPGEVFASDINEYKIRIDSGNPEHNPRAQSADYHYKWYSWLVGLFPPAEVGRAR